MQTEINFLAPAKNQLASVLKLLIENDGVSERETSFNGFRSRISDLIIKHDLNVRHTVVKFTNQFGRKSDYRKHFIYDLDKQKAIELYEKINRK